MHSRRLGLALLAILLLAPAWCVASLSANFNPRGEGRCYPTNSSGRSHDAPSVTAYRITDGGITLDGVLDDPVWAEADAARGFKMHEPERGGLPTEETVFKIAYDSEALYFGVACYENNINNVTSKLTRRDRIDQSDVVSIYIDPYLDRTTGYNFRVNPHGVQEDHFIASDGNNRDRDWDAVWDAEVSRDENGWYVEVRIPFSSVRYRAAEEMTWGLQVYRWMHGRGEDTGWAYWDRETSGFVSRFGLLTGMQNIPAPRQLEITPYFVTRGTDPSEENTLLDSNGSPIAGDQFHDFENFGADVKYGVTSDLTLNATIQPDFGQVEADPSVLNLSPFETFFQEKRPFFIEGAQFFRHRGFNLFYSRRIGTEGGDNSRIRFASKITGKTAGEISVATLIAATDITGKGQAHNLFRTGTQESNYFVTRFGKEFKEGTHSINVIQTGAIRPGADRRNAYTTGVDFEMNFKDRGYQVTGSFVGSVVRPAQGADFTPSGSIYGTGGSLEGYKQNGIYRGGAWARWEGDRLDINDLGFLSAPDEINGGMWAQRRINGDGESLINRGNINLNLFASVLYAGNSDTNPLDSSLLWRYDRGHHQSSGGNVNAWMQFRNYWSFFSGVWHDHQGTSKFETRGGPLMTRPTRTGSWVGFSTDFRKPYSFETELNASWGADGYRRWAVDQSLRWAQSTKINHRLELGYSENHRDAQFIGAGNYSDSFASPFNDSNFDPAAIGGAGIGGVSYVFGELDTQTFDVTLRTDLLFNRNQSLELYMQPFMTVGSYRNPRELEEEDTYDFSQVTLDASQADFNFVSLNMNLVYRWEYRPGSTLFLVWTHSRGTSESRSDPGFHTGLAPGNLFGNEPENVVLAKLTYWLSI